MTSLRASSDHEPLPSISEPPSPVEEDLAKASSWDDESTTTLVSSKWKGKGKQGDDNDTPHDADAGQYPPMAEEELETRKVEENLKRWEAVEKQRRRKARESYKLDLPTSTSSSFIGGVGRHASQLWRKTRYDRDAVGRPHARTSGHAVLESADEASSPAPTPRPSNCDNPFESQEDRMTPSPGPLMTPASPPTPRGPSELRRPSLHTQPAQHPPLQPLAFSDQRTPGDEESVKGKRWWTEWLCGCQEQGDLQAGRTNPME